MHVTPEKAGIRAQSYPICAVCGTDGVALYHGLRDRLFGVPGEWDFKRCPNCGLIWLDPQPIEADITKAYENYYTHDSALRLTQRKQWARAVFLARHYGYHEPVSRLTLLQRMIGQVSLLEPLLTDWIDCSVMYLPFGTGKKLLEIGTGSGDLLREMAELGWKVEGVEIDPVAVKAAEAMGLTVREGTLIQQAYPENTFDAIVMSHVIEHVYQPEAFLIECYRILKPGGTLVVLTPNASGWIQRQYHEANFALDPPRHLHYFTFQSMRSLIRKAGFDDAAVELRTIARNTNTYLFPTLSIQKTGRFIIGTKQSLGARIWAKFFQLRQWMSLRLDPTRGEEIVVIAHK